MRLFLLCALSLTTLKNIIGVDHVITTAIYHQLFLTDYWQHWWINKNRKEFTFMETPAPDKKGQNLASCPGLIYFNDTL